MFCLDRPVGMFQSHAMKKSCTKPKDIRKRSMIAGKGHPKPKSPVKYTKKG